MRPQHTIIVSGSGRCGSSLTMQMLHSVGIPTVGGWPIFEGDLPGCDGPIVTRPAEWRAGVSHKAVKLLEPHLSKLPLVPSPKVILLTRDPQQQASSMLKLMRVLDGLHVPNERQAKRALAKSIIGDMPKVRRALSSLGPCELLEQTFEELIGDPIYSAMRLCNYLGIADPMVAMRMSECVRPRSPECEPTMGHEMQLVCTPIPLSAAPSGASAASVTDAAPSAAAESGEGREHEA